MNTYKRILQSLGIVAGAMLFGAGIAFATNITVPSAPAAGYTLVSTSTGAYITVAASSTTNVYIDSNRVDTYTADGSILKPYKTITAANTAVSAATSITLAAYHIAPGTYTEQSMTLPNIPLVIYGQGATIILLSGPNLGAGLMTIPNDISFYDPVIFGNVSETDTSQTNPHTFTNGFIAGNFNVKGNATFTGGAIVDQNTAVFPFLSQSASSTLIVQPNSITNFNGDNIQVVIQDNGTINLNDDNLQVSTSTAYALTATTTGSSVNINGLSLENFGTGGGINMQNGATNSLPNEISAAGLTLGVGTTNAINAGSAVSYVGPYTAFTLNGTRLYATGSGLSSLSFAQINTEGTTTLAQNGGNVGIGTTTPFGTLSITAPTSLGKAPAFIIASSTSLGADASSTFVVYPQGVGGVSVPVVGIGTSTPAQAGGKGPNLVISAPDGVAGALLRLVGHLASGNGNIIDGSCDAAGNNNCFNGLECLDSTTGGCDWRLFRSTSNAGNSQNAFEIYKGDGTASLNTHLTSNGGSSYIDALGGNLGIGTTTPSFTLQDNGILALGSTANSGAIIEVERTPGSNTFRPIIQTDATGNLFMSSPSGINTDLILGDNSQLSTGFNYQLQIHFPGSNSSGDAQIWMATSSGKVGIGNSAPTGKLEISGNVSSGVADVLDISNPFTNTGTCARINWNFSTTLSAYQAYEEGCRSNATGAGATYLDWATNNGTALGERMRLSEVGNLGIGTTSPWAKLSVNGQATDTGGQPLFVVASSTAAFATTTDFLITNTGVTSIGTTTTQGILNLGTNPTSTNSSTTISVGKLQWDGYDAGGARRCVFINASGVETIIAGACNP